MWDCLWSFDDQAEASLYIFERAHHPFLWFLPLYCVWCQFLSEHTILFCDFYYCTVFDANPYIIMLLRLFFEDGLVSHQGVLINNLAQKKMSWGGDARYSKLDPRLIRLICVYSVSKVPKKELIRFNNRPLATKGFAPPLRGNFIF